MVRQKGAEMSMPAQPLSSNWSNLFAGLSLPGFPPEATRQDDAEQSAMQEQHSRANGEPYHGYYQGLPYVPQTEEGNSTHTKTQTRTAPVTMPHTPYND